MFMSVFSRGDNPTEINEEVLTIYSEILYKFYVPTIVYGKELMICREIINDLVNPEDGGDYMRIHTGSSNETLLLLDDDFQSDLDVMTYKIGEYVVPRRLIDSGRKVKTDEAPNTVYLMDSDGCYAGFVNIYKKRENHLNTIPLNHEYENGHLFKDFKLYPSSQAMDCFLLDSKPDDATQHGPALTTLRKDMTKRFENDLVYCIPCPQWPDEAQEWIDRKRSNFPCKTTIEEIVKGGCYVVPTDHPYNKAPASLWRLSFSVAEGLLIRTWSSKQVLTFHLLKYYLKHYKQTHPLSNIDGKGFSSYHIKTLVMWACENIDPDIWQKEPILSLIRKLVTIISKWVEEGMFPSYWVPMCNLLDQVTDFEYCKAFVSSMDNIAEFILDCFQSSLMVNIMELEAIPLNVTDVQTLREAALQEIQDWEEFTRLRKYVENVETMLSAFTKILQHPSEKSVEQVFNLLSEMEIKMKENNIEVQPGLINIIKGRYLYVKYNDLKGHPDGNSLLPEAITCFKDALKCDSLVKELITDLASTFLANIHYDTDKYQDAVELCDLIISHDLDEDYNACSFGKIGVPELYFTSLEQNLYELEQNEDFPVKPNAFAVLVKLRCLQLLNQDITSIDQKYVKDLLKEGEDNNVSNFPLGLLEHVLKQLVIAQEKKHTT